MMDFRTITTLVMMLTPACMAYASAADDAYISGYAHGLLKHEFNRDMPELTVKDAVITFPEGLLDADREAKAVRVLTEIPGLKAVKIEKAGGKQSIAGNAQSERNADPDIATAGETLLLPTGILPVGLLFKPLLADPRWAHFSATYRNYQNDNFAGKDAASVSFGETMPFYRANFGRSNAQWELGMQAGVFSDFNLNTSSKNLVNTDFIASAYSSVRVGEFSLFGRLYHQSSHLGDEFLLSKLNSSFQRVNLSYEGADLRLSYELPYGVRVYGGGGGIVDKEPSTLKTWSSQYGLEFRSPWLLDFAAMRPIAAVDIKQFEEDKWSTDISARAGIEFDNTNIWGRKLQLLVEYFNGYTPVGQFYKDKVEYLGLGAHFHF